MLKEKKKTDGTLKRELEKQDPSENRMPFRKISFRLEVCKRKERRAEGDPVICKEDNTTITKLSSFMEKYKSDQVCIDLFNIVAHCVWNQTDARH